MFSKRQHKYKIKQYKTFDGKKDMYEEIISCRDHNKWVDIVRFVGKEGEICLRNYLPSNDGFYLVASYSEDRTDFEHRITYSTFINAGSLLDTWERIVYKNNGEVEVDYHDQKISRTYRVKEELEDEAL